MQIFGQEQYAQIPMAVVGIVMKFFQIVISIVVGMAAGCIPVVGYNMGAGKTMRVRQLFTALLTCGGAGGRRGTDSGGGFPPSAYRHLRRRQRKRLLHRFRRPEPSGFTSA